MAVCPKCHTAVEGPEAYICCAGTELEWRCTHCAKVSEGFAFPYGMCPYCGGALEALHRDGVSGEASVQAIRTAFEIEIGGLEFYTKASAQSNDPALKELFGRLAGMERGHMSTLTKRYHLPLPAPHDGFRVDLAAVKAGIEGGVEDPVTLFKAAIAFEQRAASFFDNRSKEVPAGSAEQQLYRELAAEEVEHVAMLETEFALWSRGREGLI